MAITNLTLEDFSADLLPCPFCGSTELELTNTHTPSYWIECGECGCQLSGDYGPDLVGGEFDTLRQHEASAASAIAKWNARSGAKDGQHA